MENISYLNENTCQFHVSENEKGISDVPERFALLSMGGKTS